MRAAAALTVGPGRRVGRLHEDPPIGLRVTPDAVYLVGTAGGPTGSDHTELDVDVVDGGTLTVRSAASTVLWSGAGSSQLVRARVGAGAALVWAPEPVIVTAGADHAVDVDLAFDSAARVDWTETVLLGRHGEGPGRARLRLRADVGGRPLLRHELDVGAGAPGWDGPAVLGANRAVGVRLLAGAGLAPPVERTGPGWAWLALDGPGWLLTVVAADLPGLVAGLARAAA